MKLLWFALFALTGVVSAAIPNQRIPTKSDVPNGKLVTYEILHENPRTVQFYWPAQTAQTTTVEVQNSNGFLTKQLLENNRTSFTVENQDSDSRLEFHILQQIGARTVQQVIHVPAKKQLLNNVKDFDVRRLHEGYKFVWRTLDNQEQPSVTYTMVWCDRLGTSDQCVDGEFGYHSIKDTTMLFIPKGIEDSTQKYKFGIVASTDRSSSGIQWAYCLHQEATVANVTSITGEPVNATSIRIRFHFRCPAHAILNYEYRVTYRPVDQPESKPATMIVLNQSRWLDKFEIVDLEPETEYKIRVEGRDIVQAQETIATTDMGMICVKVPKSSKKPKLT